MHVLFESNLNSLSWSQGYQTALKTQISASVSQLEKRKKTCKDFIEDRPIVIPETDLKLIPLNSTLAVEERCSRSQIISEPVGITGIIYAHHVLRWIFLFNTPCLLQITCSSPGWRSNPFLVSPDIWIPLNIPSVFDSKCSRALTAYIQKIKWVLCIAT